MGIYSTPLFVRTSHGTPDEVCINIATWSADRREEWATAGFLTADRHIWTLRQLMEDTPPHACHRVYWHLDPLQINRWIALGRDVIAAYPQLEWLQFHFWCSDETIPYYLEYRRDAPAKLFLKTAKREPENRALFLERPRRTWTTYLWSLVGVTHTEEPTPDNLDQNLYTRNLDRIQFGKITLGETSTTADAATQLRSMLDPHP